MTAARAGRLELSARAAAVVRSIGTAIGIVARRAVATWRGSLQLRVGATTVVATGVVVLVTGVFVVNQVSSGILHAKRDAAVSQATIGYNTAREVLQGVDPALCSDVGDAQQQISANLSAGGTSAGLFSVIIRSPNETCEETSRRTVDIPSGLRRAVGDGNLAVQFAPVPRNATSRDHVPGLIVGEPAGSGPFQLYYLFPLTTEQQTIALVQRTVWFAGLALVILVLAIALLVTRQVVRPVRVAAQTATKLASGDLAQRIPTKGDDDIARLGQAFNDMADSLQRQFRRLEDLSRLQRRFTSDVSHELRTPLTTIRMASEYLLREPDRFRARTVPLGRVAARGTRPIRVAARGSVGDLALRRRRRPPGVRIHRHPTHRQRHRRGQPDPRRTARQPTGRIGTGSSCERGHGRPAGRKDPA